MVVLKQMIKFASILFVQYSMDGTSTVYSLSLYTKIVALISSFLFDVLRRFITSQYKLMFRRFMM